MKMIILLGSLLVNSIGLCAENDPTIDFINQQKNIYSNLKTDKDVMKFVAGLQQKSMDDISQRQKDEANSQRKALYFVSFSIPHEGLQSMLDDAWSYSIPLVVRGLKDNDLRKTATAMFDLVKEKNESGIMIDPPSFERFNIKAVPALVVMCDNGSYDVVTGSVKIKNALELISRRGDCAEEAKKIIARIK